MSQLRVGDFVTCFAHADNGAPRKIEMIATSIGDTFYDIGDGCGCYYTDESLRPLTVADAFALAGFPVPEGAKLHISGCDLSWTASIDGPCTEGGLDVTLLLFGPLDGEHHDWLYQTTDWRESESTLEVDLSRLPLADAFDALPQVIRDAVEAKNGN